MTTTVRFLSVGFLLLIAPCSFHATESWPQLLASGFEFPEGPSFLPDNRIAVCDVRAGCLWKVDPATGEKTKWVATGGWPNGSRLDSLKRLIVADARLKRILRISPDGSIEPLSPENHPLNGPNDVTVDSSGTIYFTDPSWKKDALPQRVYRLRDGVITPITHSLIQPNGIAFNQKGDLFIAEGGTGKILKIPSASIGDPSAVTLFANIPDCRSLDGIKFDREERLHVALFGKGRIAVLDRDGKLLAPIPVPGTQPTNLEFSPDFKTLYVTEAEKGALWKIPLPTR